MKQRAVKLSKITEIIQGSGEALSQQDAALEVISQQITHIHLYGCSGLQCNQCCLKKKCNRTPKAGQAIANLLWAKNQQVRR